MIVKARAGARTAASLLRAVGRTPLVELRDLEGMPAGARLFCKWEAANPGGSIKDRPIARIVLRALREGRLAGGRRLLDSSSGNAGIAYAWIGAALGVPVTLVLPGNASRERIARIRAHGAEVRLTDPLEGYDAAIREARRLAEERPDLYFHADQYANEENVRAHEEETARELLEGIRRRAGAAPDLFVAGVGTGGTFTGVGRALRSRRPDARLVAVTCEAFPGIEGLKPLGEPDAFHPPILDLSLADRVVTVTSERALARTRELARHGIFAGPSSGANVEAAVAALGRGEGALAATVLPDGGERYLSTGMWDEEVRERRS